MDDIGMGAFFANIFISFFCVIAVLGSWMFYSSGHRWTAVAWMSCFLNVAVFFGLMGSLNLGVQVFIAVIWPLFDVIIIAFGIVRFIQERRVRTHSIR